MGGGGRQESLRGRGEKERGSLAASFFVACVVDGDKFLTSYGEERLLRDESGLGPIVSRSTYTASTFGGRGGRAV